MEAGDYTTAWVVYLVAGVVLALLSWRLLRKLRPRELGWLLQCWFIALMFTPWYVEEGGTVRAPALIIFVMDAVTVSRDAAIRALIPLVLSLLLGVAVTVVLSMGYRLLRRRKSANAAGATDGSDG
jgi:hypothetical protein